MIHSLSLFMVTVLGTSGALGGDRRLAESIALISRVFLGVLTTTSRRKWLAVFGYGWPADSRCFHRRQARHGADRALLDRVGRDTRCAARCADRRHHAGSGARRLGLVSRWIPGRIPRSVAGMADAARATIFARVLGALIRACLRFTTGVRLREPSRRTTQAGQPIAARTEAAGPPPTGGWSHRCGVHLAVFSEAFLVLRADQGGIPLALGRCDYGDE